MTSVTITDVVLRDGLQDQSVVLAPETRIMLARELLGAGLRHLEVAAFVNPKRVPQMADPEAVVAGLPRPEGVVYSGLSLNRRGSERAVAAGIDELVLVVSASEGHSQANAGRSTQAALDEIRAFVTENPEQKVIGAISTAFASPFEPSGVVPAERIVEIVAELAGMGIGSIGLADTAGTAEPAYIDDVMRQVVAAVPTVEYGLHLHDAHGRALETVDAAIERGIVRFDSSLAGLGGCPCLPGAHGNIATESLVAHLTERGVETGVDADRLARVAELLRRELESAPAVPAME